MFYNILGSFAQFYREQLSENVRMGTTILGYYLRKERGNYPRALQRYNGSLGRSTYSNLVLDRLVARWRYEL